MSIFEIQNYDYDNRYDNLKVEAKGVVSSTKYFPIFKVNNKEKIFKPLSKTKPYSTPLFSYSEVYWSYLLNKYIDNETPIYSLATCKGITKDQPKYLEKGCIVDNILNDGENLINILELFRKYPDSSVNIDDYINYCELQYDYEMILKSTFFQTHKELGESLAKQILCSILRRDENYHYENVSFIEKNGKITKIAPMIDFEFSQMFMFIDDKEKHNYRFSNYDEGMQPIFKYNDNISYEENYELFKRRINEGSIYDEFDRYHFYNLLKNLKVIVELYPDLVKDFINKLNCMKEEVKELNIDFDSNFINFFSSDDFRLGELIIKQGKTTEDIEYKKLFQEVNEKRIFINEDEFNKQLKNEVLWSIDKLIYILNLLLTYYSNKLINIEDYNNETLYDKVEKIDENTLEEIIKMIKGKSYVKTDTDL